MKFGFVKSVLATAALLSSAPTWAEVVTQVTQSSHSIESDQKKSGIEQEYFDPSVNIKDDFYQYVNGTWLKNTEIPADRPFLENFDTLGEITKKNLKSIIEELSKKQVKENQAEQQIADFYESFMDEKSIEELGVKAIQAEIGQIDAIKNKNEIAGLVAHFSRIGVTNPFEFLIDQDMKDSTQMRVMLLQSGLGLPNRDYYLENTNKFIKIRSQYLDYITNTLALLGDHQAKQNAQKILKLETQIAQIQWDEVETHDPSKIYNIYTINKLKTLSPNFDWQTYLKGVGVDQKIQTIQIGQPSYVKGLSPIIDKTELETLKVYLKLRLVNDFSPLLSKSFVDNNFDFYRAKLRDVKEQSPRWKRGVNLVDDNLGESLGKLYVQIYFAPEKKQRMEALVQNLLKVYAQSMDQLDWMSSATKQQAQKKLANFTVKIGYPNMWRDYSTLEIKNDDLVGNVIRAHEFEHHFKINKLGKTVVREEWGMTPQTVNAQYNPSMNDITFPASILQAPFFDMNADDAVNYGAIGAIIGHEISHGFDDQGSQFDDVGNMKDWWTVTDKKKFKEKTQSLVQQYNAYETVKGYHVNGELTLGENIADNSGLSIAYKAYQLSLNGKPAPVIDGLTGTQRFYMSWAKTWRFKASEAVEIELLKIDSHSPAKVRGNATLKNQTPFYDAFGIKEGDKMYLAPDQRLTIW